jgi:hypothetical protein
MLKRSWIFLLPLVAGLAWIGAAPSQAAGPSWTVTGVNSTGCNSNDWDIDVTFAGIPGAGYIAHTTVSSGGLVYMNEQVNDPSNGDTSWGLYTSSTYGATTGAYPIPTGQQMKVVLSLEKPKGTVLSSWTFIAKECSHGTLLFNASDLDQDGVADSAPTVAIDRCPTLAAARSNGCPLRARTLTLAAKSGPRRVVGTLDAPGYPALDAGRTVTIWKKKPGPDRKVAVRTTRANGTFKARVGKGRYYATSPGVIAPTSGEAAADRSPTVRVR